jgi:hypothetical protein
LLEAIKRSLQSIDQRGILHKSLGMIHIDLLREITVKKCILHVHLMDFPSLGYCNVMLQTYGINILYWSEGLIILNSMHLLKAFGNKPIFVSINMSIYYALGPLDPSTVDKFHSRRKGK